ncbi:MAG: zinc-ribbon domain-containing protein [Lachnospiraceae bacterium]
MFCRNCGAQIADHVKFCPACGHPLISELHLPANLSD